jgi:hypothetical protein
VILRQPLHQRRRHQQQLAAVNRNEISSHDRSLLKTPDDPNTPTASRHLSGLDQRPPIGEEEGRCGVCLSLAFVAARGPAESVEIGSEQECSRAHFTGDERERGEMGTLYAGERLKAEPTAAPVTARLLAEISIAERSGLALSEQHRQLQ